MPINSNTKQNSTFSQAKKPKAQTGTRPTARKVSRTNKAPNSKVK
jgi:hypothetical protein